MNIEFIEQATKEVNVTEFIIVYFTDSEKNIKKIIEKPLSLIMNPLNFSNFVDVYYTAITDFYEVYRIKRFYHFLSNQEYVNTSVYPPVFSFYYDMKLTQNLIKLLLNLEKIYDLLQHNYSILMLSCYDFLVTVCQEFLHQVLKIFYLYVYLFSRTIPPIFGQ